MPINRRVTGTFLLMLFTLLLCILSTPRPQKVPPTQQKTPTFEDILFTAGESDYTLSISGAHSGTPETTTPDVRNLRTRTVTTLPLYQNEVGIAPVGTLTLTIDQSDEGAVFYLDAQCSVPISVTLTTAANATLIARPVSYGQEDDPTEEELHYTTTYDADTALYLEGGGTNLYLSRIASLRDLGRTVYAREVPLQGVSISKENYHHLFTIPFPAGHTVCTGVATAQALINLDHEDAVVNMLNLNASATDYHLLPDGVYLAMPDSYRPRIGNDPHIYRAATAWLLGPCTYEENGALFTTLGKSIVYLYLDSVNAYGFIPTEPYSTWLSAEYGIEGGFYDTRFNFDTMKRLMRAEEVWAEPQIGETVRRMLDFYIDFADQNAFYVDGIPFVPDYGTAEPLQPKDGENLPACSLNHYLCEGLLLLRAGAAYDEPAYTGRGFLIIDSIEESTLRWIKSTKNLWYAIRSDGEMEKDDYIDVTYIDLVDACALLSKLGVWDEYPGIQALMATKEDWLFINGYQEFIKPHPPYTAF